MSPDTGCTGQTRFLKLMMLAHESEPCWINVNVVLGVFESMFALGSFWRVSPGNKPGQFDSSLQLTTPTAEWLCAHAADRRDSVTNLRLL